MVKRIGILGGISYESTIDYYKLLHQKYFEQNQNSYYPEIVIFSLNFQYFTDFEDVKDLQGYLKYIIRGAEALVRSGVDFILMAANSPHVVFDQVTNSIEVPMLDLIMATAEEVKRTRVKKILLLAVSFTVDSLIYHRACEDMGITVIIPSLNEQEELDRIIFQELTAGEKKEESKRKLLEIIDNYDVEGVILGCTELPLILKQEDTDKILFDTVDIHVKAALDYALSE